MILHHLEICVTYTNEKISNLRWYIQHLMDEVKMKLKILSVKKLDETEYLQIHQVCYS